VGDNPGTTGTGQQHPPALRAISDDDPVDPNISGHTSFRVTGMGELPLRNGLVTISIDTGTLNRICLLVGDP